MTKLKTTLLLAMLLPLVCQGQSHLWKIQKQGLKDSYLFGTFHIFPQDQFTIHEKVKSAMIESDQLVMELDMHAGFEIELMQKADMPGGKTLDQLLKEQELTKLDSAFEANGLSRSMFNKWRPLLVSSIFYTSYMPSGIASFEMTFLALAKKEEMDVLGLETIDRQLEVFDKFPYQDQAADLIDMISDYDGNRRKFNEMVAAYLTMDLNRMMDVMDKGLNNDFETEVLLNERNRDWVPKMVTMISKKSTFFAVGAGHLGGKQGVIRLLENQGYKVTPVNLSS